MARIGSGGYRRNSYGCRAERWAPCLVDTLADRQGGKLPGAVQRIVDVIGAQVDRPVLVEDPGLHVVAYSEHDRPTDTVRRNSILERHTSKDVVAWCRAAGVHASRRPVRVRPNRDLDFRTRVCVPVYAHDLLLGFVWFIDDNRSLTDKDLGAIDAQLSSLSAAMYDERPPNPPDSGRDPGGALASLLDDPVGAESAADRLLRDGVLEADGPTTVLVARFTDHAPADHRLLARALDACRGRIGPGQALAAVRRDHAVVLLRSRADAYEAATRLRAASSHDAGRTRPPVVGIGDTKSALVDAPRAYQEAKHAARIAVLVPPMGPVARWDRIGIYRALSGLDLDSVEIGTIHPGAGRLLVGDAANHELVATLEAYLDSAGNAAATSAALHLHRTTLYYRLQRIETLAGTDLKDGDERLCLHLALKLWRLRNPPEPGQGATGRP